MRRGAVGRLAARLLPRLARVVSLIVLAALGTIALMRLAPGYFTDAREMDAEHASGARAELQVEETQQGSLAQLTRRLLGGWVHGDLGRSRHYDVPVTELLAERLPVSAKLLFAGVGCGWLLACALALPLMARRTRRGEAWIAGPAALLLAIPVGAMATLCLLVNAGGPLLVLATLVGVRDFKLVYRLLRHSSGEPHLLYARAYGMRASRIFRVHLLPRVRGEMLALAMMSFVVALSALVPVEVVFDVPGLGQLAWSAAMNRDLPVLLAVTLLLALCVGLVSMVAEPGERLESMPCG